MNKETKEWTVDFPWGKVAVVSWGNPTKRPILLVHGYMDTAATFLPLLEHLPDDYYYVGFDLPGHGQSDPFPPGLLVTQINMVEVIRGIVQEMQWKSFIYMSHSMGFMLGVFFNHIFPGKITKMVHIDPAFPIGGYYFPNHKIDQWYMHLYDSYYSNYYRVPDSSKRLTLDEAANLLVRNRGMSEDKAELVVSRALVPVEGGKFKLSWDQRMKKIAAVALSEETLYTIITQHAPPMLIIEAAETLRLNIPGKTLADNILQKCKLMLPGFYSVTVNGGHDVHITDPEELAPHVNKFLKGKKGNWLKMLSKL